MTVDEQRAATRHEIERTIESRRTARHVGCVTLAAIAFVIV